MRPMPVPSQETLTYAPPLADGGRLYFRGEADLYCVGEKGADRPKTAPDN